MFAVQKFWFVFSRLTQRNYMAEGSGKKKAVGIMVVRKQRVPEQRDTPSHVMLQQHASPVQVSPNCKSGIVFLCFNNLPIATPLHP